MITLMILMLMAFIFITYGLIKVLWHMGPWLFVTADVIIFAVFFVGMLKLIAM